MNNKNKTNKIIDYMFSCFSSQEVYLWLLTKENRYKIRSWYADKYIVGSGLEIGAQSKPLIINKNKVKCIKYIDRMNTVSISSTYNIPIEDLVHVDIISDADILELIDDESVDFLIANHVLEHMPDTIQCILCWLAKIKQKGILFISFPNSGLNYYDYLREKTSFDHILDDFRKTKNNKMECHWKESLQARIMLGELKESDFQKMLNNYCTNSYRCHMHIIDYELIIKIINYINNMEQCKIRILDKFYYPTAYEIVIILQKE